MAATATGAQWDAACRWIWVPQWCSTPGPAEIVLISRHVEPSDLNCLLSLGIDPLQKRYVMLKSRIHWRAGLGTNGQGRRRMRRGRRLHLGLRPAEVQEGQTADLPARPAEPLIIFTIAGSQSGSGGPRCRVLAEPQASRAASVGPEAGDGCGELSRIRLCRRFSSASPGLPWFILTEDDFRKLNRKL